MSTVPRTRTRPLQGASTVKTLNCPNCGGTIALRAAGTTVSLVCEHCGSTLDATQPELRVIVEANRALHRPLIPLGSRGELDGVTWEVTGYLERTDGEEPWSEYLLFNPYEGYAFLIDDGDRFSLGRLLDRVPGWDDNALSVGGQVFEPTWPTYEARVTFVVGEFYWRVKVGERVQVTDYAAPNLMLSAEENGAERSWTRSKLLARGTAEAAFRIPARQASWDSTPRADEPSPYRRNLREALVIAALAAAVLLFLGITAPSNRLVLTRQIDVPFDEKSHNVVIGPVDLPSARQSVHVRARVDTLNNSWLDIDYSLVERRTQQSYAGYATAERYSGRDSDGAWSEGDNDPGVRFSSIPRGTYDLVIDGAAHRWVDPKAAPAGFTPIFGSADLPPQDMVPVTVEVRRGGGTGGLLFLFLVLIAAWPLILWFKHAHHEARRRGWPQSDDEDGDE
ncbi:DUF4178 domain-containing protein [Sphingomonas aerophila]|uniref:Putative RNA-binding Zn-ribbon protein involved in translation (DUF1610 family) n=1 Tax=Sphingomonas aerophila TaxID=1344948 RepID=A0A7W9ET27_9SPHN|nr:DUF4178 domain-containing protein [Sphingomonas aerophila]MBB5713750.1 putative RNA-binding Zn-ribbon protein involved in translation (DUF1610 family) [Sphingomonas aerophila]